MYETAITKVTIYGEHMVKKVNKKFELQCNSKWVKSVQTTPNKWKTLVIYLSFQTFGIFTLVNKSAFLACVYLFYFVWRPIEKQMSSNIYIFLYISLKQTIVIKTCPNISFLSEIRGLQNFNPLLKMQTPWGVTEERMNLQHRCKVAYTPDSTNSILYRDKIENF